MADESKLDYFISQTNDRFDRIDDKLDSLLAFKWQFAGALTLITILIDVGFVFYQGGK